MCMGRMGDSAPHWDHLMLSYVWVREKRAEWNMERQPEVGRERDKWKKKINRQTEGMRESLSDSVPLSSSISICPSIHLSIYLFISHPSISLWLPSLTSLKHSHTQTHKHKTDWVWMCKKDTSAHHLLWFLYTVNAMFMPLQLYW